MLLKKNSAVGELTARVFEGSSTSNPTDINYLKSILKEKKTMIRNNTEAMPAWKKDTTKQVIKALKVL